MRLSCCANTGSSRTTVMVLCGLPELLQRLQALLRLTDREIAEHPRSGQNVMAAGLPCFSGTPMRVHIDSKWFIVV